MSDEPTIKAIPTKYKGFRFRSRLEARWAVFFDALSIEWRYEEQGYDLEGVRYLPDFWFPVGGSFVEIKGQPILTLGMMNKAALLAKASGKHVLILAGNPWPDEHHCYYIFPNGLLIPCGLISYHCEQHGTAYIYYRLAKGDSYSKLPDRQGCSFDDGCKPVRSHALQNAFEAARGARFEHGESG